MRGFFFSKKRLIICYTALMQTRSDVSYGVIPLYNDAGEWKVFLIHQYSRIGDNTYWVFPKGHPENDETPKEAAARELKEEADMVAQFIKAPEFTLEYTFMFDGVRIEKTVTFFLGVVDTQYFSIDETEVKEAGWYTLEEASERLDYTGTKRMFQEVKEYVASLPTAA